MGTIKYHRTLLIKNYPTEEASMNEPSSIFALENSLQQPDKVTESQLHREV